jgi:hypothetical protein
VNGFGLGSNLQTTTSKSLNPEQNVNEPDTHVMSGGADSKSDDIKSTEVSKKDSNV